MKKGISLIVLVITIIVMIVLAASVVITLSNTGIIDKANQAVNESNLNEIQQLASTYWADGFLDGLRDDELKEYVLNKLKEAGVDKDKYNIIVNNNGVQISVNRTPDDEGTVSTIKDIEVTYERQPFYDNTGESIYFEVELLGIPNMRGDYDTALWSDYSKIILHWLNWEEKLEFAGKIAEENVVYTAKEMYSNCYEETIGMSYEEFKAASNKNEIIMDKYGYETIDEVLAYDILGELNWSQKLFMMKAIIGTYDLLPDLVTMSDTEIENTIVGWYKNKKTINEIIKEITYDEVGSIEEMQAYITTSCGINVENLYIINRAQALMVIAVDAYTISHPVVIECPNGEKVEIPWYLARNGYCGVEHYYEITELGTYKFKVKSPTNYVEEIIINVEDNEAAPIVLDIDDSVPGKVDVGVTLEDSLPITAKVKSYKYYIREYTTLQYRLVATTTTPNYQFTGLSTDPNVYHVVKVEVEDEAGNVSVATSIDSLSAIVDGVPIPKGFVASPYGADTANNLPAENTKAGGMVIYELTPEEVANGATSLPSDETQYYSWTNRNQYVWVPVDKADFENVFKRQNFGMGFTIGTTNTGSSTYWEENPQTTITNSNKETVEEVIAMYKSVKRYGGFYIARYETGVDFIPYNNRPTATKEQVHTKMGKYPYTNVSIVNNIDNAMTLTRSIYPKDDTNTTGVISTLVYGVQWDTTVAWLAESGKDIYGNSILSVTQGKNITAANLKYNPINEGDLNLGAEYVEYVPSTLKGTYAAVSYDGTRSLLTKDDQTIYILTTGALKVAQVNNIYDMAGNVDERTMEKQGTSYRALRGWAFANRYSMNNGSYYDMGYRMSLYIK